ncbi:Kynurenine 3-monooxygenase [Tolypothrix sp. NIES-4075]|uniref:FAD-dependent oxidoreductase n=1 Tax=Tolypothrix sp. NIES-4075 TaxID=2005459 RepID=UPI000B6A34F0|nr:NAD(P)/FAD-dependent oxidoreductase [Tolypothrix sp. NIES-4075]GAX41653.1 Kynurenine 3-monooxygenase [Tolypothrix sp. NIES-4075]
MKKVIIVGAGPAGVLLAHYLLRRGTQYKIEIYERRSDLQKVSLANSRTIPYGINERGLRALRKIEGLEAAVKATCVENHGSIIYQKNKILENRSKKKYSFNTDRTSLLIALLSQLTEKSDNKVEIHYDCKCTNVDFENKTLTFEKVKETIAENQTEFTVDYDLLIGADGARSIVRTHLLNTEFFEFKQEYASACYKTVFLSSNKEKISKNLKQNFLHIWRIEEGITFGIVPQLNDKFIGILLFSKNTNKVVNLSNKEEVMAFFQQNLPEVTPLISEEEAEAFVKRPIGTQLRTRCNRYHYGDSVLILGDAAHAVSSSLGQGCNNAFEDVLIFDSLLDEYSDEWATALEQFTIRRRPDVYALWELDAHVIPFH